MSYSGTPTLYGEQQIAAAYQSGTRLPVVSIAVGDGGGAAVTPTEGMAKLVNEVWRGAITSWGVDPADTRRIVIHTTVPATAGPFTVREAGVYDANGGLICVTALAATEIVAPGTSNQATSIDLIIAMPIGSAGAITVSPTIGERFTIERLFRTPFISINSASTATPPTAPAVGDLYIVPANPQGAWATATVGTIAEWNGTYWAFLAPPAKMVAGIMDAPEGDTGEFLKWTGAAWESFRSGDYVSDVSTVANAIELVHPTPIAAYRKGMVVRWTQAITVTGACVVEVDGLGQVPLVFPGGGAVQNLDFVAGQEMVAVSDGAAFELQCLIDQWQVTASKTFTVHGAGATFADAYAASAWISRRRVPAGGNALFQLAAGKFAYGGRSLSLDHPDGVRIQYLGATPKTAIPAPSAFVATGSSAAVRAQNAATNLATARAWLATEMAFTGAYGVDLRNIGVFSNILVTGDGSAVDGITARFGFTSLSGVVSAGFGGRGIVTSYAAVGLSNCYGIGCGGDGIQVGPATTASAVGAVGGFGNGGFGVSATGGVLKAAAGIAVCGSGNGLDGVTSTDNGSLTTGLTNVSVASYNAGAGFSAYRGGNTYADYSNTNYCTSYAYYAYDMAWVSAVYTTGSNNGSGYGANEGSFIRQTGGACAGLSPASNTVGNNNSYILS